MIKYVKGNMFESDADCLVNTVNCEGYMGKGIAYQFKMRFPENNRSYVKACRTGMLTIGKMHYYIEEGITIINFPTKDKWRENSKMEYIKEGMEAFLELIPKLNVKKIAIPPLGCGNGGLEWQEVKTVIEHKISKVADKYEVLIYEPSISYKAVSKRPPKLNLLALVLLDIRLNLKIFNGIRLQKTGYFVNLFLGEEYFKFEKGKYGPYSHSIDIVAKNIKEYQAYYNIDNSKTTFEQLYQVICSEKVNHKFEKIHSAVKQSTEYINQIGADKQLEGIATVLFLIREEKPQNKEALVERFKVWSEDKANRFSKEDILECIDYLEETSIISKDICDNYELTEDTL